SRRPPRMTPQLPKAANASPSTPTTLLPRRRHATSVHDGQAGPDLSPLRAEPREVQSCRHPPSRCVAAVPAQGVHAGAERAVSKLSDHATDRVVERQCYVAVPWQGQAEERFLAHRVAARQGEGQLAGNDLGGADGAAWDEKRKAALVAVDVHGRKLVVAPGG